MKIAFVWQGITGRYGVWDDGLREAMRHIEKVHTVTYHEPSEDISGVDVILYWEAPCTILGRDQANYNKVRKNPIKKALLFAGGRVEKDWLNDFDHVFVESKINKDEFDKLGISNSTAFGINERIMVPKDLIKKYDGIHHGTCASWKRQWLVGEALKSKGLVVGRYQKEDPRPFDDCKRFGCNVMDEKRPEEVCDLLNESHVCVQTSEYWGGGQRCTLEAFACDIPVICMKDSPKNREYVEEALGPAFVIEPQVGPIYRMVQEVVSGGIVIEKGHLRKYVMSKWTSYHYAAALLEGIDLILDK